jgi:IS5 family transposase
MNSKSSNRWGKKYVDKRDWKKYNEKLVSRGEAYVSLDFLVSWKENVKKLNKHKRGRPYTYPDSLMIFMAYLHILLSIDYRGLQGFLKGLTKLVSFEVPFSVPHYSVICRRVNKLDLQIRDTLIPYRGEDVVISLDSTGVKISNRGEWMRQKWKVRRGWIKVHISVDNKGKQVVGIAATEEDTHDTKEFGNLVDQSIKNIDYAGGRVAQANGDGAYDSNDNFKKLEEHGILPTIKIRKQMPTFRSKNPRKKYAREFHELGYKNWRDKYGYGKRWYSEVPHSVVKRKCGEYVLATDKKNMYHEVMLKYLFYNSLIKYDECGLLPWQSYVI